MYNDNENSRSYFFRNLIVKILLVLLFVFLLMWLFPMPNLSPFYDKIFTQNISEMTDAAKAYFTTARLPQEEGESKTLTLQDMLDNKMIIEFTDSDGNKCDTEKSYVEVTKKDGEYIFKTNLSCPNEEDYVIEYFGCYDVCEDCKKSALEYQFYKNINENYVDSYTCKDGYTLSGKNCVSKTSKEVSKEATKVCASGYTYNANTNKCEKTVTETVDATVSCQTGYTLNKTTNKCEKLVTETIDATVKYTCSNGTLSGTKCIVSKNDTKSATANYSCPSGYTLSGTTCTKQVANTTYSCPAGYTESNGNCVKTTACTTTCSNWVCSTNGYKTSMSDYSSATFTRNFAYQVGTTRYYNECSRNCSCTGGGTTYAGKVANTTYQTVTATPSVTYTCESGYSLSGTTCTKIYTENVDATATYSCSTGYTLSGNKCTKSKTDSTNVIYTCSIGVLTGTKCTITTTDTKDVEGYTCEDGYTLKNGTCYTTTTVDEVISATAIYKTRSVKTYKWSTEKELSGWTRTGLTREIASA